jgi:hypothetical protein
MHVQLGQHRVKVAIPAALIKPDTDCGEVGKPAKVVSTAETARHISTAQTAQQE